MSRRTIHTERLDLVPWQSEHGLVLAQLARASAAVPSLARDARWDPQRPEVLSRAMLRHWEQHGFGWRAISERAAAVVTGFAGITVLGENSLGLDPADFEFGCWVHPSRWRRGVAGEASAGVIDEAFERLGALSLMGCARSDHQASLDGARGLGFVVERELPHAGEPDLLVLRLTADAWATTRGAALR